MEASRLVRFHLMSAQSDDEEDGTEDGCPSGVGASEEGFRWRKDASICAGARRRGAEEHEARAGNWISVVSSTFTQPCRVRV